MEAPSLVHFFFFLASVLGGVISAENNIIIMTTMQVGLNVLVYFLQEITYLADPAPQVHNR